MSDSDTADMRMWPLADVYDERTALFPKAVHKGIFTFDRWYVRRAISTVTSIVALLMVTS